MLLPIVLISACIGSPTGKTIADTNTQQTSIAMVKDCGSDITCFSDSVKTCEKAKITLGTLGTLAGLSYYEIEGTNDTNHCKVKFQANSSSNLVLSEGYCYIEKTAMITDLYAIDKVCSNRQQIIETPMLITKSPSELVLKLHDLPVGYAINKTNITQTGYEITFLKGYEPYSLDYGVIVNGVDVYPSIDKAEIVFDNTKNWGLNEYSEQSLGYTIEDESFGLRYVYGNVEGYVVDFRKNNVFVSVLVSDTYSSISEAASYAQVIEKRISQ